MNLVKNLVFILTCSMVWGTAGGATISEEQEKLARLQKSYQNYLVAIEDVKNNILTYRGKVRSAQADVLEAKKGLAEGEREVAAAKAKSNTAEGANQDNKRELKKATHSHKMAIRSLRSRNKRLSRLKTKLSGLRQDLNSKRSSAALLKKDIVNQEEQVAQAMAFLERRDPKSRKKSAQNGRSAKAKPAAAKIKAPVVKRPIIVAKPTIAPARKSKRPVRPANTQSAAPASKKISAADKAALAYAKEESTRLKALLARGPRGKPTYKRLVLRGARIPSTNFEFLGKNQYRAEVAVPRGQQQFKVGNRTFRRTIPVSDAGETYVFIYDAKRLLRPRLVMFKKSLIEP